MQLDLERWAIDTRDTACSVNFGHLLLPRRLYDGLASAVFDWSRPIDMTREHRGRHKRPINKV
jgi:hypothetical protein